MQTEATRPLKVLVVDDEATIVEYMRKLLSSWGHQVLALCCDSQAKAAEVLEHIRFIRFDAALVDCGMPRGPDLAIAIKRLQPSTKIIIMTIASLEFYPETDKLHREGVEFDELLLPFEEAELSVLLSEAWLEFKRILNAASTPGGDSPRHP